MPAWSLIGSAVTGGAPSAIPSAAPRPGAAATAPPLDPRRALLGSVALRNGVLMAQLQTAVPTTAQSNFGASVGIGGFNGGGAPPAPGAGGNLASGNLLRLAAKVAPAAATLYFLVKGNYPFAAAAGAATAGAILFL